MRKKKSERRRFLVNLLYKCFSTAMDDPRVRKLLSPDEAEEGLRIVINEIVKRVVEQESRLGRNLTFNEFRECIMKVLDDLTPKTNYIV